MADLFACSLGPSIVMLPPSSSSCSHVGYLDRCRCQSKSASYQEHTRVTTTVGAGTIMMLL